MPKLLKIGIAGCGAIGSSLAKAIVENFSHKAELVSVFDTDRTKAYSLASSLGKKKIAVLTFENLLSNVDFVIESTSVSSAFSIVSEALSASKDIMVMSSGGIFEHFEQLSNLATEKGVRLFIPSGAICGVDGIKAQALGKINTITLTSKKPPRAFKGITYILKKKINLDKIKEDTVLYEGEAKGAIKFFPQNINVASTLSLAARGRQKVIVRIIASPNLEKNIHEIEVDSESGKILARTENVTHPDNPKTSYLAVLSAIMCLKEVLSPIKIGT